jgi:hypothetical protein
MAMGTERLAVPVAGFAVNVSPMLRMAPPPLGSVTAGNGAAGLAVGGELDVSVSRAMGNLDFGYEFTLDDDTTASIITRARDRSVIES